MEEVNKRNEILKYIYAKLAQAPFFVKDRIHADGKPLLFRQAAIRLQNYAESFIREEKGASENRIIVLPGLRGVGKTTMLLQLYDFLIKKQGISQDKILYFSTDELKDYLGASISDVINVFIEDILKTTFTMLNEKIFILIDETHFDEKWDTSAKIVYDQSKNVFLLLTGSSALNIEMSMDLARRARKEKVFPLSFSEYLALKYGVNMEAELSESITTLIFNATEKNGKDAINRENESMRRSLSMGKPLDMEFSRFITSGDLPFGLELEEKAVYDRIFSMIERVIEKDVFVIQSFNTETRAVIKRIVYFLASQSLGGTSDAKLAKHLETSSRQIRNILDVLEKTHLIFSIKPYGGAGKVVRKPWKYYFLSPSVNAAIRFRLGLYDKTSKDMFGVLIENMVASCLVRMKETINLPTGIFYDSDDGGADFIVQDGKENIIPIEVGSGKKDKGQIERAIKKYKSRYGIIICGCPKIKKEGNIVYIPFTTFSSV